MMKDDLDSPIVAMVRKARQEVAARYDYDLAKLCQALRRRERAHRSRIGTPRKRKTAQRGK